MSGDWKRRPEGGGYLALRLIRAVARHGGRRLGRSLLYPITVYFTLVRGPERRASIQYLERVLGRPARWRDGLRHVHAFAATILDRVFLLSGRLESFQITVAGLPQLHAALDRGRGVLLFGSHLGSFEALRVLARERPDCTLKVVLDKAQAPALTRLLDELDPKIAANVIDASQDGPAIVMQIHQACSAGAMVALLVDRVRGDEPALPARFLGEEARFPTAPWLIAAALRVPVVLAFGLYRGGSRYDLVFEPFADPVEAPRGRRTAALSMLIRRYAARLETFARGAPYNWFNFYDFWNHEQTADDRRVASGEPGDGDGDGPDDALLQRRTAAAVRRRRAG